ncbi:hypothetical protein N9F34_04350 [Alphaproteobacteria bacterium]|nr:hypothetical protein [Alphaproteobacteria bacterium]
MWHQTIVVKAPASFINNVLWSESKQLDADLATYLADVTDRVIREKVRDETGDADSELPTFEPKVDGVASNHFKSGACSLDHWVGEFGNAPLVGR